MYHWDLSFYRKWLVIKHRDKDKEIDGDMEVYRDVFVSKVKVHLNKL